MLESIRSLPTEIFDYNNTALWNNAYLELKQYIVSHNSIKNRTNNSASLGYMERFMHIIDCLKSQNDDVQIVTAFMSKRSGSMLNHVNDMILPENTIGICVNEEAGTHFVEENFNKITRMPGVEKLLKQTSSHFLRIFTTENNHILYVWTNKPLEPKTVYHLKHLQHSLNKKYLKNSQEFADHFYDALVKEDLNGMRAALQEFLKSDYVKEIELRKFRECMVYNTEAEIKTIENRLSNARDQINNYENIIMELARNIRDYNENIEMLKNKNQDEDINILYKYLKKHPYIRKFLAKDGGMLFLEYTAPLLYYNEYALNKMIKNRTGEEKEILNIIKERKYTLWTRCALELQTSTFRVYIKDSEDNGFFPHPHIERYHCFGNHNTAIAESAISGDYIGAIEQMSQAVLNINFYDTCVINEMLRNLIQHPELETWIKETTGELISLKDIRKENETE